MKRQGKVSRIEQVDFTIRANGNVYNIEQHPRREKTIVAVLETGMRLLIACEEILRYYNRQRLSNKLLDRMDADLKGKTLLYDENENLVGKLKDYID